MEPGHAARPRVLPKPPPRQTPVSELGGGGGPGGDARATANTPRTVATNGGSAVSTNGGSAVSHSAEVGPRCARPGMVLPVPRPRPGASPSSAAHGGASVMGQVPTPDATAAATKEEGQVRSPPLAARDNDSAEARPAPSLSSPSRGPARGNEGVYLDSRWSSRRRSFIASEATSPFSKLSKIGRTYSDRVDPDDVPAPDDRAASPGGGPARPKQTPMLPTKQSLAEMRVDMMITMMSVQHTASALARTTLTWDAPPKHVLLIHKPDPAVMPCFVECIRHLQEHEAGLYLYVEEASLAALAQDPTTAAMSQQLRPWVCGVGNRKHQLVADDIDLVVSLGGDGTLMFSASQFTEGVPPILAFSLGSLGFLTPFKQTELVPALQSTLHSTSQVTLRMRLRCEIVRLPGAGCERASSVSQNEFVVLNELVVDRGPSPYLSNLEILCDGQPITRVQGDGVIVSTPTGSTAYSASAGGSMVHPTVPCILLTPICPHSLSFRPIIVPATAEVRVQVPANSRNGAWVSIDGKNRQKLQAGEYLRINGQASPAPTINRANQSEDWFASLAACLNWNVRELQKPTAPLGAGATEASAAVSAAAADATGAAAPQRAREERGFVERTHPFMRRVSADGDAESPPETSAPDAGAVDSRGRPPAKRATTGVVDVLGQSTGAAPKAEQLDWLQRQFAKKSMSSEMLLAAVKAGPDAIEKLQLSSEGNLATGAQSMGRGITPRRKGSRPRLRRGGAIARRSFRLSSRVSSSDEQPARRPELHRTLSGQSSGGDRSSGGEEPDCLESDSTARRQSSFRLSSDAHEPSMMATPDAPERLMAMQLDRFHQNEGTLRTVELEWMDPPQNVLVVKKPDPAIHGAFVTTIKALLAEMPPIHVYLEEKIIQQELAGVDLGEGRARLRPWAWSKEPNPAAADGLRPASDGEHAEGSAGVGHIDLIICLGGDGTLMFTASWFQKADTPCPPIMAFSLGSLGFLTPFPFKRDTVASTLHRALHEPVPVTLRMRLRCDVVRVNNTPDKDEADEAGWVVDSPLSAFSALNEIVVDRGPSSYLTNLEILCDGQPITRVQGDGVIVSTPTGSTAYSASAGGSMVHPTVPCILLTPICPHSLSFRPIVVPSTAELRVRVVGESRNNAWVAMDGQNRQKLRCGDYVRIISAVAPIPTVNVTSQSTDWFQSLSGCLNWNLREVQQTSSQQADVTGT